MIIGICGKSGSGKSTLARKIKEKYGDDAIYLDIDKIGHKVLSFPEVRDEIVIMFGPNVADCAAVDRKRLGEIVFASRKEMKKLSDITWKYMQIEIDEIINSSEGMTIILDWILLPITKYFTMCDKKILLDISYEERKRRAMERDGITEKDFDLREKASINFKNDDFDYVLNDDGQSVIEEVINI